MERLFLEEFSPFDAQKTLLEAPPKTPSLWHKCLRNSSFKAGLLLLLPLLLLMLIGPSISGYLYDELHLTATNEPPSLTFWLGTDELGRDLFTRVSYGIGISLLVGFLAGGIDLTLGLLYGGVAGFFGGKVDEILMRIADILYALPYLLVVILVMSFLGHGLFPLMIALTLTGWITMARMMRGEMLRLKERDFVLAAQLMGASSFRILLTHLLPNALGPILITLTLTIPSAIFSEAFLSFLGLGINAPMASLGSMTSEGLVALQFYPWRLFVPALFLFLLLFSFHLIAEGLKSAFTSQES